MFSTKGRYAIRIMIDLAEHDDGSYIPLKDVAARQELSKKYLEIIAKDMVAVYPPGIPVTVPGDVIGSEDVETLLSAIKCGLEIKGLKDKEIAVLWEKSST